MEIKTQKGFDEDILTLKEKLLNDDYAQAFYAAFCNIIWVHRKSKQEFSYSWRASGGLVARIRNMGEDYIDFYCSGDEGSIRSDVLKDMQELGYKPRRHGYKD